MLRGAGGLELKHCGASYRSATKLAMLYQRWQRVAHEHAAEVALTDLRTRRRWTFGELRERAEKSGASVGQVSFPQGNGPEFVFTVLNAWQTGAVLCPLETGQAPPNVANLPDGIVHLKTTSATTGKPRLVAFTEEQLAADADNIVQTMELRRDWPNLGVISLAHSYGFSNLVLPLLLHGIPLLLLDSPFPEAIRTAASEVDHLTLPAVPALWRAWHEAGAIPRNIRLAISAGAPLPLPLELDIFTQSALKLHNFCGATECGGIAYDASEVPRSDGSCIGAPMKNVVLSISGDGCLEVRSRAVGQGYWPEPDKNLGDGCYRTSDLAEMKEGRVFLRGRASDQINVAGRKVCPESIERVLLNHPSVKECLVFGAPSAEAGRSDVVVACVVGQPTGGGEALRHFLLEQLPAWQVPREWRFVESLAPNERGKLSRTEWRARLGFAVPA
jgi:long-chain acyl-CoA synthetase